MPTGPHNTKSRQVAIRLPHDLDTRIAHYMADTGLTQSQALITLLKKGLSGVHDNGRHRDAPLHDTCNAPTEIAGLVGRIEVLEAIVAKMLAQPRPQPNQEYMLEDERHYLGTLCHKGHDWQGTGRSRRAKRNKGCLKCEAERDRERRAAKNR